MLRTLQIKIVIKTKQNKKKLKMFIMSRYMIIRFGECSLTEVFTLTLSCSGWDH